MSQNPPALIVLLLIVVECVGLGTVESNAQSPTSIGGQAAILQVSSGTAPLFASAGSSFRFLPSATDNTYGAVALSGNAASGYGTYAYTKTGTSTGTISYSDVPSGISGFVAALTFTSTTAGSYSISNASYPGQSETGTFTLFSGQAPASVAGWTFQLQIVAGIAPYATVGTAQIAVASSGNTYQITAESGNVVNSSGTYTYTTYPQNSSASSSLTLDDTVLGAEYTQTLSWQTSTSGAYVVRNVSTGGYQTGTFTGTPPASQFTTTSDGHGGLIITGYSGTATTVVIPSIIAGLTVTSITNFISSTVTNLTIPDSVTSIGATAFDFCPNLVSVTIGNGVVSIGDDAFNNCTKLTSVTLGSGLTTIGQYAFNQCNSLPNITIPSGVTSIGANAFQYCNSLTSIAVSTQNSSYSSVVGILFNKNQTTLIQYPEGLSNGNYAIPNTVTSIGQYAFSYCNALTNVTIGNALTTIGPYSFAYSTSLTSVTIPNNVTSIGTYAFAYSSGLTHVTIPNSVTGIGTYAFDGCSSLSNVMIGNGVTTIGDFAFQYCTSLLTVAIPNSVTTIGQYTFGFCNSLTNVTIGNGVTSIGAGAFNDCPNMVGLTIGTGVTAIGNYAFNSCSSLASVTIPKNVTSIGAGGFSYCSDLTSVYFQCNAPTMGTGVFSSTGSAFTVYYYNGETGFTSPIWLDSSGDTFSAVNLGNLKIPQLIAFPVIADHQYPTSSFVLYATATSGLSVSFSLVSGPATLSGPDNDTVTVTGTGTVVIQASQAGSADYLVAPTVNQSFNVALPVAFTGNPTATPEGDGVPNLMKYLYGIVNPAIPMSASDRAALPVSALDVTTNPGTEYLTLTYRQYALATGITVRVQTSSDMQNWTTLSTSDVPADYLSQQVGTDSNTGDPIMEVGVKVSGSGHQFIRLNVTQP